MEKPGNEIKILIADDHKLFRSGILGLLSESSTYIIVNEAENGHDLIKKYFHSQPDIILVDISMPVLSGLEAVKSIKKKDPAAKALFLSMYDSEEYVYACLKVEGAGLINKNISKKELFNAIEIVYRGGKYFLGYSEPELKEIYNNYEKQGRVKNEVELILTKREELILRLISDGLTSSEIADQLNVSKRTVDTHRVHLIQKLNLKSLPELIKYALEYSARWQRN